MVVRVNKNTNYTVMSNIHLMDRNLSLKAKGLLSVVLSLPDDWDYSVTGLASISKEKESAISSALKELKEEGYLVVTKKMPNETRSGRIEYEWDFYEDPHKQETKKQGIENQGLEYLTLDVQGLENQGQLNTNKVNTNILNTKEVNTKEIENIYGGDFFESLPDEPSEKVLDEKEKMFLEFWELYPRKVDKEGCRKAFKRINKLKEVFPEIIRALEIQRQSEQWTKDNGQFIPYPKTYIHQERWLTVNEADELQAYQNELVLQDIQNFNLWRNDEDAQ